MRVKRVVFGIADIGTGITPAHAGKTTLVLASYLTLRDHPRACG